MQMQIFWGNRGILAFGGGMQVERKVYEIHP